MMHRLFIPVLMLAVLLAKAEACAVCANGDNLQLIEASNSVLWTLLTLVGFIFVATGTTIFYLWRKANMTPQPPEPFVPTLNPADAND
jgi:hypothetical protein